MLLGAHCSIAGGFVNAAISGKRIGCEAIQVFARSPRMLRSTKPIDPKDVEAFWDKMNVANIRGAATHANYLINLAATSPRMLRVARTAFTEELDRAHTLRIPYVIFHPGAHMGKGEAWGLKRIAESLDRCIGKAGETDVMPLLEITAGSGTVLGSSWEQLREVIESSSFGDRLGVCVDTCHALAAGIDLRTPDRYDAMVREIDAVLGLRRVRAFHLNDSKGGLGSHLDRHEHIGKGEIGLEPFRWIVNDPRFADALGLLETPGEDPQFRRNLKVLKSLRAA